MTHPLLRLLWLVLQIVFWLPGALLFTYASPNNHSFVWNWDPLPAYYFVLGVFIPVTVALALTHQSMFALSWDAGLWAAFCTYMILGLRFNFKYVNPFG